MNIPFKNNPVLLDVIIQDIQRLLQNNLHWLDYAFGRAYKIESTAESGPKVKYPAVYTEQGEYFSVLPDDKLGNYSFILISDPTEVEMPAGLSSIKVTGSIIFWLNLSTIYAENNAIYSEEIKSEILRILTSRHLSPGCRLKILKLYEQPENIFREFSIQQTDTQYLLYPYYGLRIEVELKIEKLCY